MIRQKTGAQMNSSNILTLKKFLETEEKALNKSVQENEASLVCPNERRSKINKYNQGQSVTNNIQFNLNKPSITFRRILRTIDFPASDCPKDRTPSTISIYQPSIYSQKLRLRETSKSPNEVIRDSRASSPLKFKIQPLRRSSRLKPVIKNVSNFKYKDILTVNRLAAISKSERSKQEISKKKPRSLTKAAGIPEIEDVDCIEERSLFTNDYLKFQYPLNDLK